MIVGGLSIDPRRVVYSKIQIVYRRFRMPIHILSVGYMLDGNIVDISEPFESERDIYLAQIKLDKACYKGPLADAISNQTVDDEGDDEEQERIGFR